MFITGGVADVDLKNKVMVYCCQNSAWKAVENARAEKIEMPNNINFTRVPCLERLNIGMLIKAFEDGADGVFVIGCPTGSCTNLNGTDRAKVRVAEVKNLLNKNGNSKVRIDYCSINCFSGHNLVDLIKSFLNNNDVVQSKIC